jgi:ribosomal subunit interface protein
MTLAITFLNMEHSAALEQHAQEKFTKIDELLSNLKDNHSIRTELRLRANKQHPHHSVEFHVKTTHFSLHAHDEGTDMYTVLDTAIDKMVVLIKKEKGKLVDKIHKHDSEKRNFNK